MLLFLPLSFQKGVLQYIKNPSCVGSVQHFILFSVVRVLTTHIHRWLLDFSFFFWERVKITAGPVCFTNNRKFHNIPLEWNYIIAILHLRNMLHMLQSDLHGSQGNHSEAAPGTVKTTLRSSAAHTELILLIPASRICPKLLAQQLIVQTHLSYATTHLLCTSSFSFLAHCLYCPLFGHLEVHRITEL